MRIQQEQFSVIGERIRELRLAQGLCVQELAERAVISGAQVYRLESNERPNVSAILLARVAIALNTSMEYLLGIVDDGSKIQTAYTDS